MNIASTKIDFRYLSLPLYAGSVYSIILLLKGESLILVPLSIGLIIGGYYLAKILGTSAKLNYKEMDETLEIFHNAKKTLVKLENIEHITHSLVIMNKSEAQFIYPKLTYKDADQINSVSFIVFTSNEQAMQNLRTLTYLVEMKNKEKVCT